MRKTTNLHTQLPRIILAYKMLDQLSTSRSRNVQNGSGSKSGLNALPYSMMDGKSREGI